MVSRNRRSALKLIFAAGRLDACAVPVDEGLMRRVLAVRRLAVRVQESDEVGDSHVPPQCREQPGVRLRVVPNVRAIQGAAPVASFKSAEVTIFRPEAGRAAEDHALRRYRVEKFLRQIGLVNGVVVKPRPLPKGLDIFGHVGGDGLGVGPTAGIKVTEMFKALKRWGNARQWQKSQSATRPARAQRARPAPH